MLAPPLRLFLVRHGVTDGNEQGRLLGRSEIELNRRGRVQAAAVATALQSFPVCAVLASPQCRAQQTAAEIASPQSLEVRTEPDLAEVRVGKRWLGKTFVELQDDPDLIRAVEDPTYVCDVIESADTVQRRVIEATERVRATSAGGDVVLVSHGDPLRLVIAHYLGLPLASFRRLHVATGSVSVLRFGARRQQLAVLNWQPGDLSQALEG